MPSIDPSDLRDATEEAIRPGADEAAEMTARAAAMVEAGELAEAQRLLTAGLALDAGTSGEYYWIARILQAQGEPVEAISALHEHVRLKPLDDQAYSLWAECLMDLGRPEEAHGYVLKALDFGGSQTLRAAIERCSKMLGRPIEVAVTKPDYSWVDWKKLETPPEFRMSLTSEEMQRLETSFRQSFIIHMQVVGALIHREILTRFGRSRLGYLWAVVQPMALVGIMYIVFLFAGRKLPEGILPIGFLLTGFVPFRFFAETRERVANAIKGNLSLLYFRQVSLFSVVVARTILEFLTNLVVFALLVCVAYLFGEKIQIRDPLQILWGTILLTIIGLEFGLIVAVLNKLSPAVENMSQSISRILFLISGLFFYANELPEKVRSLLLLNPIFHILEFIREGYFVSYQAHYASATYVHACVLVGAVLSLSLKRVMYHRLLDV